MLNFPLTFSLMTFSVSGFLAINMSSTWTDITISNFPFSYFVNKMYSSALLLFRLHALTKSLANSLSHNIPASTFPYINFLSRIQYSLRNSSLIIPKYTMPSGHSIYTSTSVLGWICFASTSHNSAIHPLSS